MKTPYESRHRSSSIRTRKRRALAVVVLSALALTGCASDDTGSAASEEGAFAEARAAAQERIEGATDPVVVDDLVLESIPAGGADLSGETVLVIPLATSVFSALNDSIAQALAPTGADVQVCDGKASPTDILSCMEQATSIRAAAVITLAVSPETVGAGYQQLYDAGIPVYAAWQEQGEAEENELLRFYSLVPTNERSLRLSSDYTIASSETAPTIHMVGVTDSDTIEQLNEDWHEYTVSQCADCTIVYETSTTAQAAQVKDAVASQLITDPDTDAILSFNLDTFGAPIVEGVANSSVSPRIGGQGAVSTGLLLLQEGRVDHVAGISYFFAGYAIVDGLLRLMNGLDATEYTVPIRLFTAENVADLDLSPEKAASYEWHGGDDSFIETFTQSWGVG